MKYFLAQSIANKPFVTFSEIAKSLEDLQASEFDGNQLVVAENEIPDYQFGVCTKKIVGGALIALTAPELAAYEAEDNIHRIVKNQRLQAAMLKTGTFAYDGSTFPMNETARLYYQAFDKIRSNVKVLNVEGTLYSLAEEDIDAFLTAFYIELITLTKPAV
jgi:hypothetical protein